MKKNYASEILLSMLLSVSFTVNSQICPVSFLPKADYSTGSPANGIASADFNGDGNIDLAFLRSDTVRLMLGSATGIFSAPTPFAAGSGANDLIAADLDKNGTQDLITANFLSNEISVLLGTGTGSFIGAVNYPVASGPRHLACVDFNNDTQPDIVVSAANVASVSVLLGTGTGTLLPHTPFSVGSQPQGVVAADFNNDGNMDIVSSNQGSNNVSLLLGDGTGGFATSVPFSVSSNPRRITCGDFNADGKMDVATANFSSPQVSVLLGTGTGSFAPVANYISAIGAVCYGITSADFNNDSVIDIAVANNALSNVSVLSGDGTGTFTSSGNFPVLNVPLALTPNDFNNDGRIDLAVTNAGASGGVSVLINNTALPVISVITADSLLCAGQTTTLTASGANTYSWNTGASTSAITVGPVVTTTYTVTGTDTNSCSNMTTFTQQVTVCTEISDFSGDGEFRVFPNPFQDRFILSGGINETIRIYTVQGKMIRSIPILKDQTEIRLDQEDAGIYFIRSSDGNYLKIVKL